VDVIVTTTPASEPILFSSWLCQGQHVTAMGSDAEHKNELDPAVLMRADLYVADSLSQVRRLGELHHAINAGSVGDKTSLAEIGAVISGRASGRVSPSQITVCDLTGTGAQDTAIGTLAWARAAESRLGTVVEN
jgi:ornithine cyclodeaminase